MRQPRDDPGGAVLLTGATGFLGGPIAVELLRRTPHAVHCLVRGRSAHGADARLRAHLGALGLGPTAQRRLVLVHGDLAARRLGLAQPDYDRLADTVHAVYHCGASVNLAASHDRLEATNVGGTRAIIALTAHRRPKLLHYVSSLAAFIAARAHGHDSIDESAVPTPQTAGPVGYAKTKVEAEAAIRAAGIPAAIYRPGLILADSRTGVCPDTDLLRRLVRAAISLGLAPTSIGEPPVGTVDFVARALVELSLRPDAAGGAYHLVRPTPFAIGDLFGHARGNGHPLADVTVGEWRQALTRNAGRWDVFVMAALWPLAAYILAADPSRITPDVDSRRTWSALEQAKIAHPALNAAYFRQMLLSC